MIAQIGDHRQSQPPDQIGQHRQVLKYQVSAWEFPGVRQCWALQTRAAMLPSLLLTRRTPEAGGGLADGADAVLLVHQDLPDLLGVVVAAFGFQAGGLAEQLPDAQQVGIIRLGALRAA